MITTCSARKRVAPNIRSADLPRGPQHAVSRAWAAELARATAERPASDIYMGRAFATALRAARELGAELAIVSAGLGVVMATTLIPGYDLTLARGGLRDRVDGAFDPHAWWRDVVRGPYSVNLDEMLQDRPLVLACLSQAYAPLVGPALAGVPQDRLRVFGTSLDGVLPPAVAACVLPYDDRLETAGRPGTRADFAQRALLHYATSIVSVPPRPLAADRAAVSSAFEGTARPRAIPKRPAADDDAIRAIIERLLPVVGKRSSKMLQYLRHHEGVACEQGRFARLFADVAGHR